MALTIGGRVIDAMSAMAAAGHSDRAGILEALRADMKGQDQGLSISDLAELCELDRFATSRHLAVLRSCGLVSDFRLGYRRMHQLRLEAFETIEDWVIRFTEDGGVRRSAT